MSGVSKIFTIGRGNCPVKRILWAIMTLRDAKRSITPSYAACDLANPKGMKSCSECLLRSYYWRNK